MLDVPNERSSHIAPTVRGAGLALAVTWGIIGLVIGLLQPHRVSPTLVMLGLTVGLSLIGFSDDLRSLSVGTRVVAQVVICFAAVLLGVRADAISLPDLTVVKLGALALPLCTLALVGMVNLFNFMDGIDGLAIGQTLVASLVIVGAALLVHASNIALLAAALAGAAAGFLPFNWSPAKCFMGDSGSYFCGGALGGLLLLGQQSGVPLILVGLANAAFILDATITLIVRLVARKPVWQAHRSHAYQRLVAAGWSHARVAGLYMTIAAAGGLAALLYLATVANSRS